MEFLTLDEVRRLLDEMVEWRLLAPLGDMVDQRYEGLCEYERRLLSERSSAAA